MTPFCVLGQLEGLSSEIKIPHLCIIVLLFHLVSSVKSQVAVASVLESKFANISFYFMIGLEDKFEITG